VKSPSLRDVFVARHLCDLESSKIYPFLVLLINIDCGQRSWVYGMHYSCFGVLRDCPKYVYTKHPTSYIYYHRLHSNTLRPSLIAMPLRSFITLDLCVPSLSPDSAADYKSSSCINSDSTISLYIGEKSAALMSHAAATAINQSVETELVASQLIDDIKVTESYLTFILFFLLSIPLAILLSILNLSLVFSLLFILFINQHCSNLTPAYDRHYDRKLL
jgi:hypothetical protein